MSLNYKTLKTNKILLLVPCLKPQEHLEGPSKHTPGELLLMLHGLLFSECSQVTENIQYFGYCRIRIPAVFPQKAFLWEAAMSPGLKGHRSQLSPNIFHEAGRTHISTWGTNAGGLSSFHLCRWTSAWCWCKWLCLEKYSSCLYDEEKIAWWGTSMFCPRQMSVAAHVWGGPTAGDSPGTLSQPVCSHFLAISSNYSRELGASSSQMPSRGSKH